MSVHSNNTADTLGHRTLKSLHHIREEAITFQGDRGFFVSRKKLDLLEKAVESLSTGEVSTSVGPSALIAANQTIQDLQLKLSASETRLQSLQTDNLNANKKIEAHVNELNAVKVLATSNSKQIATERDLVRQQLTAAQSEKAELLKNYRKDFADMEMDAGEAATIRLNEARQHITELNNQLQAFNNAEKKHKEAVAASEKALASAIADRDATALRLKGFQKTEKLVESIKPVASKANFAISDEVKKFLGHYSSAALEGFFTADTGDTREKAYNLMLVAKKSSNDKVSKLYSILQKVFEWVKTHSMKVRNRVKPWLDLVANDLATKRIRTLEFYRMELEKLIKLVDEEKQVKLVKSGPNYKLTLWDHTCAWTRASFNHGRRNTKKGFKWFWHKCKSTSSWLASLFKAKDVKGKKVIRHNPIVIFDAEGSAPKAEPIAQESEFKIVTKPGKLKSTFNPFASKKA